MKLRGWRDSAVRRMRPRSREIAGRAFLLDVAFETFNEVCPVLVLATKTFRDRLVAHPAPMRAGRSYSRALDDRFGHTEQRLPTRTVC